MTFWIVFSLMALVVAAPLIIALLRGKPGTEPAAAYDLRVYRDQLKEVDRDLARGVIGEADAERVRAEVSRRILAADAQLKQKQDGDSQATALTGAVAVLIAILVFGGSLAVYLDLGNPGRGDQPLDLRIRMAEEMRASRPAQSEAEANLPEMPKPALDQSYKTLLEELRAKLADRPDDLQGHILLARHEANAGNYQAAYKAEARVIDLMGDTAGADEYAEYGELLVLAAGGYVSPEAEAALKAALEKDPTQGPARFFWGLMLAQVGRPDQAFVVWEETLRQGPPDAPWLKPIRAQIEEMAWRAGVKYTLPAENAPLAGPSSQDIANAGAMSGKDRQAMIKGMVDRLATRLASEGGSAQEWARLIGALGVLGDAERAAKALSDARKAYQGDDAALALFDDAASKAGSGKPATGLAGPSAEDVANAGQMNAGDRQDMIRGMVQRLSDRLATEGGSAAEWARLISSLGVLGEEEKARTAFEKAKTTFEGDEEALTVVDAAARKAGLIQ